MHGHSRGERTYLEGLIADFGDPACPPLDEAMALLRVRYDDLMRSVEAAGLLAPAGGWPVRLLPLARTFHGALFSGILSNAGEYRSLGDPDRGVVGFGGLARRRVGEFRYSGVAPDRIDEALRDALAPLQDEADPARSSILMYRRFVRVHPFYDANGRIGRLLVTFFLVAHGQYPDWERLDARRGKFLRKLNDAHDHAGRPHTAGEYERLLVDFWRKHVRPLSDFFGRGEDVPPG